MTANQKSQIDKFREAAREAECDTNEERFERALKVVIRANSPLKKTDHSDIEYRDETDNSDSND